MRWARHTASAASLLGDGRFDPPLNHLDRFGTLHLESRRVDLMKLKQEAEATALRRADRIHQAMRDVSAGDRFWAFITSHRYRRGSVSFLDPMRHSTIHRINQLASRGEPVVLIISFFPCKVRQPLKTFSMLGSEIDLGEIANLLRFSEITRAVEHLVETSCRFVIMCDGNRYRSCFNDSTAAINGYKTNLQKAISYLGIT